MDTMNFFGVTIGFIFYFIYFACATLTINQIIGPDSVEITSADELILECDFEAQGEDDVVLKWFFNGLEDQIYQWIASSDHAYALGSLKDLIDPTYKVSDDPNSKFRALKFKEVSLALTGNYSCKVDSTDDVVWLAKQVIVYSPPTSFEMFLIGGDDEFQGDEVILCDASNVSPKPKFNLFVSGVNGSRESSDIFNASKKETVDHEGLYNVSITLPFNSSYLDDGTTKFVCQLSIPGTNYTETKSVEYFVDFETEPSPFELLNEEYASLNCTSNSAEENPSDDRDNGHNHLQSSLILVLLLMFSLVLAT